MLGLYIGPDCAVLTVFATFPSSVSAHSSSEKAGTLHAGCSRWLFVCSRANQLRRICRALHVRSFMHVSMPQPQTTQAFVALRTRSLVCGDL